MINRASISTCDNHFPFITYKRVTVKFNNQYIVRRFIRLEKSTKTTKRFSHHQQLVHRFIIFESCVAIITTITFSRKLVGA